MSVFENDMRASLKRHAGWLKDDLINGMKSDGLVHGDNVMRARTDTRIDADILAQAARGQRLLTPLQASAAAQGNENMLRALRRVHATAARIGLTLGDEVLSVHDLDVVLKKAGMSLESRLEFKAALHALRLV